VQHWHAKVKDKPKANANDRNLRAISEPQLDRRYPEYAKCYRSIWYHVNIVVNVALRRKLNHRRLVT
jgi:hypothetical protein